MDRLIKWYVRLQEYKRGQSMAEYGLIVAAIAVVCYAAYNTMGTNITTKITALANDL
jgi:Flp pilus assembly pilin Flp